MDCLFGAVWEFSCSIAYEFTFSCVRRGTCIFEKLHFFYVCSSITSRWSFDGEDLILVLMLCLCSHFLCFFLLALKNCLTQLYLNFSPVFFLHLLQTSAFLLPVLIHIKLKPSVCTSLLKTPVYHINTKCIPLCITHSLSLHSWCSNAKVVINKIIGYSCGICLVPRRSFVSQTVWVSGYNFC